MFGILIGDVFRIFNHDVMRVIWIYVASILLAFVFGVDVVDKCSLEQGKEYKEVTDEWMKREAMNKRAMWIKENCRIPFTITDRKRCVAEVRYMLKEKS